MSVLIFENNLTLGYSNPLYDYGGNGMPGGFCLQGCNGTPLPIGTITRTNNLYYGVPAISCAHRRALCQDPLARQRTHRTSGQTSSKQELEHNFNFAPNTQEVPQLEQDSPSPEVPSLLLDYNGLTRPCPHVDWSN